MPCQTGAAAGDCRCSVASSGTIAREEGLRNAGEASVRQFIWKEPDVSLEACEKLLQASANAFMIPRILNRVFLAMHHYGSSCDMLKGRRPKEGAYRLLKLGPIRG